MVGVECGTGGRGLVHLLSSCWRARKPGSGPLALAFPGGSWGCPFTALGDIRSKTAPLDAPSSLHLDESLQGIQGAKSSKQ